MTEELEHRLQLVTDAATLLGGRVEAVERVSTTMTSIMVSRVEDLTRVTDRLSLAIFGEGEAGLTAAVTALRTTVEALHRDLLAFEERAVEDAQHQRREALYKYLVWVAGITTLLVAQYLVLHLR